MGSSGDGWRAVGDAREAGCWDYWGRVVDGELFRCLGDAGWLSDTFPFSKYTIQAMWTAAFHKIPCLFLILNNRSYRVLKQRTYNIKGVS